MVYTGLDIWQRRALCNPNPVPAEVSNAQARVALRNAGALAAAEAAIAAAPADVQDAWNNAPYIHRDSALVAALGAAIGLSSTQIDALFVAAAAISF